MAKDKLCRLEIDVYNATRKFVNKLNKENHKQIYFAKMEDQVGNGTNSTIFKVDCLGCTRTNGIARAIYISAEYNEEEWKIKIDGNKIHDKRTDESAYHKIVGEYKEFLIQEIPEIKRRIVEDNQVNNHNKNYNNNHYNHHL